MSWLRSVIRARVGCAQTADDLAGDVVQDALLRKESWLDIQAPGPWLYRVAIRKVYLENRRAHRQAKREEAVAKEERQATNEPIELLIERENHQEIWTAMNQLRGQDAEILVLKYVHGWSYQQISQNLGVELKKIAGRLRTARENLKKLLTKSPQ